jgi:type I restriction enzyme S subunit
MKSVALRVTETGGRDATTRHIPPKLALAVGMPSTPAPKDWRWTPLTELARLESGHTPSRRHPEYWGGTVPWIGIQDAKNNHGRRIEDTREKTNELGIKNSSARILPENTVCLSRTASVGYVVVMGRPMATSQDFVNWVCSTQLDHNFLKYLFIAEGEGFLRFSSGAVHQTIYFPEVKAFHICFPAVAEQQRIVSILDEAFDGIATAKVNAEKNLQNARALFENHMQAVFTQPGEKWVRTKLGAEVNLLTGFPFKSASYTETDESVRLLRGDNIVQGSLRWDDVKKWPASETSEYARYRLLDGDVVLAMDRPWVKAGLKYAKISEDDLPCLLVQRTARLRTGPNLENRFLMYLLGCEQFTEHILGVQTGIGVPHISGQQIKDFQFLRPSLAAQRLIADKLDELKIGTRRLESVYQQKLAALNALKESLLHHAFTGKL